MTEHEQMISNLTVKYRGYLWAIACANLGAGFRNQLDPGDLVQATLARVVETLGEQPERDERSMLAWLRQVLGSVLVDEYRRLHRDRRDIDREQQLIRSGLDSTAANFQSWLAADQTSPSLAAERNEQMLRLADALQALPADQREAIVLRYLQGCGVADIAARMGRTVPAVAGLLRRGLEELRHLLPSG
ncbi:MAG: polymerase sigma factor SigH [Planctomycetota bacterium]